MSSYTIDYRVDLQGLRGIAILLVIFAHVDLGILQGGFVGVDVFFVLSGFLITGLLLREYEVHGCIDFLGFYARRLKRLLPALLFLLIIITFAAFIILSNFEASRQLSSAPFAATWTSNIYFSFTSVGYFDELANRELFLHTWSLGVEEQFYLIWPAVIVLLFTLRRNYTGSYTSDFRLLSAGMGMLFIISFVLSIYWMYKIPQAAFYMMPSRVWQFSLGGFIYLAFQNRPTRIEIPGFLNSTRAGNILLASGLFLILGSAIILDTNTAYPGVWVLAPSLGAALLIMSGTIHRKNILIHPVLVWTGDRSYSLYLWHWPIFMLGFSMGYQYEMIPGIFMITLSFLAAIFSYRFIELPFWKGQWGKYKPTSIVITSVLVMSISVLVLYQIRSSQFPINNEHPNLSELARSDTPEIYQMGCDTWYFNAQVEPCLFGNEFAQNKVVLIGDSIGTQWYSIIPNIFSGPDWSASIYTKSSCPLVDKKDYYYSRIGKIFEICTEWRNSVLDEISRIKPDVVFIGSSSTYPFDEIEWVGGTSRVLEHLSEAAGSVFIIPGTPRLGFDGPGCIARNISPDGYLDNSACSSSNTQRRITVVSQYLEVAASRYSNVYILNLNDLVCPAGKCNAVTANGMIVFRDSQHLTDSFVVSQVPQIRQRIETIISIPSKLHK